MSKAQKRNEQFVRKFFKTLSTGNLEKLRPMFHEKAKWQVMATGIPGAGEKTGRNAIIDEFLGPIRGMFIEGDPKVKIRSLISDGPMVLAEAHGTGSLRNGKQYDNQYAFVLELKDGKIFALREYMDSYHVSTLM
jgi:ketosteroid isomerase-like protein